MHDNYFRTYDPSTGRCLSADPIGQLGLLQPNSQAGRPLLAERGIDPLRSPGLNLYAYVGSDPVNFVDPTGLWRLPDYVSANLNVAVPNPWTGTFVGWSGTASLDRYGNWYWSPLGGGVGKSATLGSFNATANWLNQCGTPTQPQLQGFLSGHAFNAGAGFWGGGSYTWTPGVGSATGVGFFTPQAGVTYNYSFHGGNLGVSW